MINISILDIMFEDEQKNITIEDLENLLDEDDSKTANALREFINNYKNKISTEEEKERKSIEHFKSLGIPESALCSPVKDDINCQRLEFGIDDFNYSGKPEWYVDYNTDIWISSSCQNLLDILVSIEEETKQKIVKFGLKDTYYYATKENRGNIRFGKIEGEVDLSECNDSFNLKLSDGRYFHLYFCESK